jgi:hypothetical protein
VLEAFVNARVVHAVAEHLAAELGVAGGADAEDLQLGAGIADLAVELL